MVYSSITHGYIRLEGKIMIHYTVGKIPEIKILNLVILHVLSSNDFLSIIGYSYSFSK